MQKTVEASAEKVRVGETKRRGSKGQEKEVEKGKDDGSKESGRGMGNIG